MPDNDEQTGPSNETGRDMNNAPDVPAMESSNMIKLSEPLDENNWTIWKERMKLASAYVVLKVTLRRWDFDDSRAQFITINNVTMTEMVHISTCTTAHHEETNISEHLTILKKYWEWINLMSDDNFKLPDLYFKIIISSSLPSSWDIFTEPFVGGMKGEVERDTKKLMFSQEFIGILKEEYSRHLGRAQIESRNQAVKTQQNLIKRITHKGVTSVADLVTLLHTVGTRDKRGSLKEVTSTEDGK
ncbi:hypothetical protein EI94DRAFT_1706198 [Lactarius quietus]|nr:hypothetical protein EI94DRAFT_1706198 [Lactarius quietus]